MTEPKRPRSKREKVDMMTKEEMVVMKYLRFNAKTQEGKFQRSTVPYFSGSDIIDCLMQSKFSSKPQSPDTSASLSFPDRKSAVAILFRALQNGLFMRVERKKKRRDFEADSDRAAKLRRRIIPAGNVDDGGNKSEGSTNSPLKADSEQIEKEKAKKDDDKTKKPPKLLPHDDQVFLDTDAIYMWLYDPIRPRNVVLGSLLVFGAIAICLYPIWPRDLQLYTAYASRCALVVLGLLLAVILFRYVLVAIVYVATLGRVTLWLFPNINDEKRGVVDSFKPVYTITYNDMTKNETDQVKKDKDSVDSPTSQSKNKDVERKKKDITPERSSDQPRSTKSNFEDGEKKRAKKKKAGSGKSDAAHVKSSAGQTVSAPSAEFAAVGGDDDDNQFEVINRDEL